MQTLDILSSPNALDPKLVDEVSSKAAFLEFEFDCLLAMCVLNLFKVTDMFIDIR